MASDDVFHIIGYTIQNILDDAQMKLTGLGHIVLKRNEELSRQVGPLVAAAQAGPAASRFSEGGWWCGNGVHCYERCVRTKRARQSRYAGGPSARRAS